MVDGIVGPYDRVDKQIEARQEDPHHVKACGGVPCLHMPWERNEDEEEAQEREDGEERIGGVDHGDLLSEQTAEASETEGDLKEQC